MSEVTSQQVRHRLVGAVIVLSLLVIVVPFFMGANELAYDPRVDAIESLPPAPTIGAPTAPTPMPPEAAAALEDARNLITPSAPLSDNVPLAWGVQAGSFSQQANARRLVEQFESAGWTGARVERSGEFFRVVVGPAIDRARAEGLKSQIKTQFNLDGQVIRFQP